MEIDYAKIGNFMQEALEGLEKVYPDNDNASVKVGEMMIIVELSEKVDEDHERTHVTYYCSDPRRYIQVGLIMAVLYSAHEML